MFQLKSALILQCSLFIENSVFKNLPMRLQKKEKKAIEKQTENQIITSGKAEERRKMIQSRKFNPNSSLSHI